MAILADHYRFIVNVDTHAATHTYAILHSPSGRFLTHKAFPTSTAAGLARAASRVGLQRLQIMVGLDVAWV